MSTPPSEKAQTLDSPWLDLAIRLSLIAGLLGWSFVLVRPFLSPIIWGAVLAVAFYPLYDKVLAAIGQRKKSAATLFVLVPIVVLSLPIGLLAETLASDVLKLNDSYKAGTLMIPPPAHELLDVPLIGKRLHDFWASAHADLPATVRKFTPQLLEMREAAVSFVRGMATVLVKLLFSLIVMAIFLATAEGAGQTVRGLCARVAGPRGDQLVSLARDTTRSVAKGIVGVAAIQAALAAAACVLAGVPATGIWTIAVLILAIAQLPPLVVLGPIAAYLFSQDSMITAVLFTVWSIFVSLIDNILKPLLLGKGVKAPMLVVFMGAIGGLLTSGVLGLFVGPVVLVVTFTLVRSWANLAPSFEGSEPEGLEFGDESLRP